MTFLLYYPKYREYLQILRVGLRHTPHEFLNSKLLSSVRSIVVVDDQHSRNFSNLKKHGNGRVDILPLLLLSMKDTTLNLHNLYISRILVVYFRVTVNFYYRIINNNG